MFKNILMFIAIVFIATSAFAFKVIPKGPMPKGYFIGFEGVQSMPGRASFSETAHRPWVGRTDLIRLEGLDPHLGRSSALGFIVGARWTDLIDTTLSYHFGRRYHMQSWGSNTWEENEEARFAAVQGLNAILENNTFLFNLILNGNGIPSLNFGKFEPFIGGGLGIAVNRMANFHGPNLVAINDNETMHFSWQLTGGVRYYFMDRLNLEAGYRFIHFGDFVSGDKFLHNEHPGGNPKKQIASMKSKLWAQELFMTLIFRIC